jgi:hypothetical protein
VAHSSDSNYRQYLSYGNHRMLPAQLAQFDKVVIKESKRAYVILANRPLSLFTYNCHVTSYGVAVKPAKKDRPFSDASFHPTETSVGVNDGTDKDDELPVEFQLSELRFLTEVYTYRISFPDEEVYIGDDDILSAFKHLLNNLYLVGMLAFIVAHHMGFNTAQTLGGTTSPPILRILSSGQKISSPDTFTSNRIPRAELPPTFPPLDMAPLPSHSDIHQFAQVYRDSKNPGIITDNGTITPPGYNHHVDDNMYCAIAPTLHQTVSASILSLYMLLGTPNHLTVAAQFNTWRFSTRFAPQSGLDTKSSAVTWSSPITTASSRLACVLTWPNVSTRFLRANLRQHHGRTAHRSPLTAPSPTPTRSPRLPERFRKPSGTVDRPLRRSRPQLR